MPLSILLGLLSCCLLWGWLEEASVFTMSWCGLLRIGEATKARRADLILPRDSAPGIEHALLCIRAPKTRGRSAHHQAARIDPLDIVFLLDLCWGECPSETPLWPWSGETLRKRLRALLVALKLPERRGPSTRTFDLGSFRPGGATWILGATDNAELCRRRGRWLSARVMEVYLQEVTAAVYMPRLSPEVRRHISELATAFPELLNQAASLKHMGIPSKVWYQCFLRAPDAFK